MQTLQRKPICQSNSNSLAPHNPVAKSRLSLRRYEPLYLIFIRQLFQIANLITSATDPEYTGVICPYHYTALSILHDHFRYLPNSWFFNLIFTTYNIPHILPHDNIAGIDGVFQFKTYAIDWRQSRIGCRCQSQRSTIHCCGGILLFQTENEDCSGSSKRTSYWY